MGYQLSSIIVYAQTFYFLGVETMLSPKVRNTRAHPEFFQTPSPVKRSLFMSMHKQQMPMLHKLRSPLKRGKSLRFFPEDVSIPSEDEDAKEENMGEGLPFKTYTKRRDSGCHEISGSALGLSSPRASSAMNFNSCSSGDENNSDSCFNSPVRGRSFRSPRKNLKPRIGVSNSPGSSSGVSCTSPSRSPPETPPHTRKLRALTLFDTPHTPKTLMNKLRVNIGNNQESVGSTISPVTTKTKPTLQYFGPISEDVFSFNSHEEDEDYSSIIHKSNVHISGRRPAILKNSPLVNINPFTPDNRPSCKRTRSHNQG